MQILKPVSVIARFFFLTLQSDLSNWTSKSIHTAMKQSKVRTIILGSMMAMLSFDAMAQSAEQRQRTTEDEDTLREIIVRPDTVIRIGVSPTPRLGVFDQSRYSLGGILQRRAPVLQDQMLHPFAVKERKNERKRKKVQQVLDSYDSLRDPLQELLDSVARARGYVPEKKVGGNQ